jgi:FlaA1/EpsC-like NDP-sugar epimerase
MRNRYVLLADQAMFVVAVCGAFGFRFDWYFFKTRPEFVPYVVAALLLKPVVFHGFGMYRRFWRYATIDDMLALALANSAGSVAMAGVVWAGLYLGAIREFSRSVVAADWLLALVATGAVRLSIRVVGESQSRGRRPGEYGKRVVIVGAGDAGAIVAREMQRNAQLGMRPVGFLDDDPVKLRKRIYGVPVVGRLADLQGIAQAMRVDQIIIAMPKATGSVVRAVAEDCRRAGVMSRTIPGVFELLGGNVSVSRLRQVEIADLLRRNPVVEGADAAAYIQGRTVLVTGAGGSIGFELSRQVAHARPRGLALLGHGENSIFDAYGQLREAFPDVPIEPVIADIRDRGRMLRVFETLRPHIVFHAAAHKHVPLMEGNPEEAISNNVLGTQNIVDAAIRVDAERLVMISSDKAVSPSSVMGASKRVAEALVRTAALRVQRPFVVVRFGNVLGSRGSVVPAFKRQIEAGGPVTITHPDMKRFFMTIPEAVHLVLQAAGFGKGGELFVLKMGDPVRIVQLAEDLIRLSGLSPDDVPIVFTGLRPGEKLEESLWEDGADIQDTPHPEVLKVTEVHSVDAEYLGRSVESLANAAIQGDRARIESGLRQLIPSFSPAAARLPSPRAH